MQLEFQIEERQAQPTLAMRTQIPVSELPAFFDKTFGSIMQRLGEIGQHPSGAPFAIYRNMDMDNLDIEAGFPLAEAVEGKGELIAGELPAGKYCTTVAVGPYDNLPAAWSALMQHVEAEGHTTGSFVFEVYVSDPTTVAPEEIQTQLFVPLE